MKQLLVLFLLAILIAGCETSSYNPGALAAPSPTTDQGDTDDPPTVEPPIVVVPLTPIAQTQLNLQILFQAIGVVIQNNPYVAPPPEPEPETEVLIAGPSELPPGVQALVDVFSNPNCIVTRSTYDFNLNGEGCPVSFNYSLGEGFSANFSVYDESFYELTDIREFSMNGWRSDGSFSINLNLNSGNYGWLSGGMWRNRYLEDGEYGYSFSSEFEFSGSWNEEDEENLDQLMQKLSNTLDQSEQGLSNQFISEEILY